MLLGLGFGISGGLLLYFNKNFWYNYDPNGRRLAVAFDYMGSDAVITEEEPEDEDETEYIFAEDQEW